MLVRLDAFLQHLHPVDGRCGLGADGGLSAALMACDVGCGACRVLGLHHLQVRMLAEEVAALHQRHGVRVHLGERVPVVVWQTHNTVFDAQLMLAHDGHRRLAQQLIVVQQRSCNGVLDGRHADGRRVLADGVEQLLERVAADELDVLVGEELVGGNVVVAAFYALYSNAFHLLSFISFLFTKKSRLGREAGLYRLFNLQSLIDSRLPPSPCLGKEKAEAKECVAVLHDCFICRLRCKSTHFLRSSQQKYTFFIACPYFFILRPYA